MKNLLIVVDMQHDFIDGPLGTKEAKEIVRPVIDEIQKFDGDVVFTRDTHGFDYLTTKEAESFPTIHCVKGSEGWLFPDQIESISKNHTIIEKDTFGSHSLAEYVKNKGYINITMVGVCTDVCVLQNALLIKEAVPQSKISIISSLCAGTTVENHNQALKQMDSVGITVL